MQLIARFFCGHPAGTSQANSKKFRHHDNRHVRECWFARLVKGSNSSCPIARSSWRVEPLGGTRRKLFHMRVRSPCNETLQRTSPQSVIDVAANTGTLMGKLRRAFSHPEQDDIGTHTITRNSEPPFELIESPPPSMRKNGPGTDPSTCLALPDSPHSAQGMLWVRTYPVRRSNTNLSPLNVLANKISSFLRVPCSVFGHLHKSSKSTTIPKSNTSGGVNSFGMRNYDEGVASRERRVSEPSSEIPPSAQKVKGWARLRPKAPPPIIIDSTAELWFPLVIVVEDADEDAI